MIAPNTPTQLRHWAQFLNKQKIMKRFAIYNRKIWFDIPS